MKYLISLEIGKIVTLEAFYSSFAHRLSWRMLSVENRYYKLNRILLSSLGLWPYQNSRWTHVQVIVMSSIYLSAIFVQLAVFITHKFTWDILLDVFSFALPSILSFLLYDIYYLNSDAMKEILEHIYYDWMSFKHEKELEIMDHYARMSRLLTKVFSYMIVIGIVIIIILPQTIPMNLDIISPLNKSRLQIYFKVEYFVDPIKYHWLIVCHFAIFCLVVMITIVAIGMIIFCYGIHACAMFKIANYRMDNTMDENVLQIRSSQMEYIIFERITDAVNAHRRAIKYVKLILSSLGRPFLFLTAIIVISLSVCLFRFLKAITIFDTVLEVIFSLFLVMCHFCYIFIANHLGQQITNCNAEIFYTVYSLPWYIAPVNMQKLLLFILQKCNKDIYLTAGGLFDASYEGFTTLVTSSISYFTVIYTVH